MKRIPLLLAFVGDPFFRDNEYATMGYFLGGLIKEWRIDGSPSNFHPTHWMPVPKIPKTKS